MLTVILCLFLCQDFTYVAPAVEAEVGEVVAFPLSISDATAAHSTQGFSMRIGISSVAGMVDVIPSPELGDPEFFMFTDTGIEKNIGCVYSLQAPEFHVFPVAGEAAAIMVFQPFLENQLIALWLGAGNVLTVGGQDVTPAFQNGSLTVVASDPEFKRGDANGDGGFSISDPIAVLNHLFGNAILDCVSAGDVDDDGAVTLADAVAELVWLFSAADPPGVPFPGCGVDPTPDTLTCEVSACP